MSQEPNSARMVRGALYYYLPEQGNQQPKRYQLRIPEQLELKSIHRHPSARHSLLSLTTLIAMPPRDKLSTPHEFGEKREYWLKYDTLADSKDKAMVERLNSDLDVLLIFAGLFSAVNTAFIVPTLADLSAPPSYRTEALLELLVMQVGNSTITLNDLNPLFSPSRSAIR
ncbi:hypothetical protein FRB95_013964 [Tulasnella sp. JGI-2019a]|nr:hypothetical protein FRB95_013964 [Tulasnella sp. JGI-2019a]